MPNNPQQQGNPAANTNTFSKGMVKDYNETFVGEGLYTHARNSVNNSHDGQVGVLGNEPSNIKCVTLPYDMVGCIHLLDDQWLIFSTDDVHSAVGIFDESACSYTPLKNKKNQTIDVDCLGLKRSHLITGVFRKRYDCERLVYFDDGLNPTRMMDIDTPPCKQLCNTTNNCTTCEDTIKLDCEKIRVAALITHPCISIKKGTSAGTLPNGSYQVAIAYTINQVKVTDYIGLTSVQGLFTHENTSSSLEVTITEIDKTFDEFELVLVTNINSQSVARKIGYYSTAQGTIYLDRWDTEFPVVAVGDVVFRSEAIEKSDAMYSVNGYLLRSGVYNKFRFNYQPQANKIIAKWNSVEYPADYYVKGNNNVGYMRDEVYAFFIRFVYNTGEFSDSYHIPGRVSIPSERDNAASDDVSPGETLQYWQVQNTGTIESRPNNVLPDFGIVRATGSMAYWQSTEKYPDNKYDIWRELCGQNIRHHKMPDETIGSELNTFSNGGNTINILGVTFENITAPLDNNGNPINSIVGYEILRSSREGNKSIIAKGLINNMREYDITGNTTKGLLQNYPYNDLHDDIYLTKSGDVSKNGENGKVEVDDTNSPPLNIIKQDIFTFHSPDVSFSNPYLNASEIKAYQLMTGISKGSFETPYKHPKFKTFSNTASYIAKLFGIISGIDVITNGITINGTEDNPVQRSIGPIPFFTFNPSVIGTGSSTPPLAAAMNTLGTGWNTALAALSIGSTIASIIATAAVLTPIEEEKMYSLIKTIVPKRQNALQYISHGFYNNAIVNIEGNRRRHIVQSNYVGSNIQQFTTDYQINNLNRNKIVVIKTDRIIANPSIIDNSRFLYSASGSDRALSKIVQKDISSYYASLKLNIPSQYGQLESIKQLPVSTCITPIIPDKKLKFNTNILFGGDIYINRFTEKNTMSFFTDWLMGEPDMYEYDYTRNINVPYPRFWINNTEKHSFFKVSSKYRALDDLDPSAFFVNQGYFYLFNSGVRDFFCESEVNLAYRDWEEDVPRRFYDPNNFTNLNAMFRSDVIKSGEYYKYDYSLSIAKLFNSSISWGSLLPRDYDPLVAATCYTYRPNRVIYSLPQQDESKKDSWRLFLTNNYKDFSSPVTAIKQINKTGAVFMMKWQSPLQFMGVEELKLDGTGAKITIGDAGLFTGPQQLQSIVNADESYEYGSNQGKYSSINTVHGVFWVSQNQGKVFQYSGQIADISNLGMKWWFARYLPSELLKVYPNYPLYDNPVKGIGVQMIYDNTHELVYVTKKDYKPLRDDLLYDDGGFYYISGWTTTTSCPAGYTLIDGVCTQTQTTNAIVTPNTFNLTRTPYSDYGKLGTRVFDTLSITGTSTTLNPSNPFWIANPSVAHTQTDQLLNGPVNRLAIWGIASDGIIRNNYNSSGAVPPINQWIGFDVCINIPTTKTYYVAIAADNQYRMSLNDVSILTTGDTDTNINNFQYLNIYPVTIPAGNHILKVEGRNTGNYAGFGVEIYDLTGVDPVTYLNAQTNYDNLQGDVIFTTRNQTVFTSSTFTCPVGFTQVNPSCNLPICTRTLTAPPIIIQVPKKIYCNFDSECFENASWTASFDPKSKAWVSFHDWHPTFVIPGRSHFMSVKYNTIWNHNISCSSYCNFYGIDYPFEIEFVSASGQEVTTTRSVEYLLEAYKYHNNCRDKFHVLDANFDHAIIYNSEQVSGLLNLFIKPKNDPLAMLKYPLIKPNGIDINFSKEENKFRFNQFWDITKNRGEYVPVNIPMFITEPNGYKYVINPAYVNYSKEVLQRKKFRHNVNRVWVSRRISGDVKFLFKISNQKLLQSPR